MGAELKKNGEKDVIKGMKSQYSQMQKTMAKDRAQRIQQYKDNKAARDEAAFKIFDVNSDDKIELDEFLGVFNPTTKKHTAVLVALGFMTEAERTKADRISDIAAVKPEALAEAQKEAEEEPAAEE